MRVYIAGPYTPVDGREETRLANIRRAGEAGKALLKLGHTPFCPHTMTAGWEDECGYEDFLRIDLEWLRLCDAILLLPGWRESPGARREHQEACKEGLAIWDLECETGGGPEAGGEHPGEGDARYACRRQIRAPVGAPPSRQPGPAGLQPLRQALTDPLQYCILNARLHGVGHGKHLHPQNT